MNILLITNSYPFSQVTEEAFIDPEVSMLHDSGLLKNGFVKMFVAPVVSLGPALGNIPPQVEVVDWFLRGGAKFRDLPNIFSKPQLYTNFYERAQAGENAETPFLRDLKTILGQTVIYYRVLTGLKQNLPKHTGQWGLYTYWFGGATSACLDYRELTNTPGRKSLIKWVITRAHGIDLYDDRCWHGRRGEDIDRLDRVFPVSMQGRDYLLTRYGKHDKIECKYLGVTDVQSDNIKPRLTMHQYKVSIVSCAIMRPQKRIPFLCKVLIIMASSDTTSNFRWVHFGSGEDELTVRKLVAGCHLSNLSVELRGNVSNAEVRNALYNDSFDCFVTLSESEGLPVSLMEAAAAGLPMVGTCVGGVSEIIDESSGVLLPANPTIEQVATAIELVTGIHRPDFEKGARAIWQSRFDATSNHRSFYDYILSL